MKGRSNSMMLLLELTLMILIFAFCAAVCLSVFASSKSMSNTSTETTGAAMWAQSAAEAYKSAGGDIVAAASAIGADAYSGGFELGLDDDFKPGGSEYKLALTGDDASAMVSVFHGEDVLFSLNVEAVTYG